MSHRSELQWRNSLYGSYHSREDCSSRCLPQMVSKVSAQFESERYRRIQRESRVQRLRGGISVSLRHPSASIVRITQLHQRDRRPAVKSRGNIEEKYHENGLNTVMMVGRSR